MSQMKQQFQKCVQFKQVLYPSVGWIKTLRELYGMSTLALAKRMGVAQAAVSQAENRETQDRITLETLRKFAHALNCDLAYVFIPREDPEQFLTKRAEKKAKKMVQELQQTMDLEDQSISQEARVYQEKQLTEELLNNPKKIWED